MRLYKIQLSGVSAPLLIMLLSGVSMLTPSHVAAQCSSTLDTTLYATTYGNTVTVPGGAVSGSYSYSLPQFPISVNTLYAVVIKSNVTVSASINITNTSTAPIALPYDQLYRTDDFSSAPASEGGAFVSNLGVGGPLAVGASETVSMPNTISNVQILDDSITNSNANFDQFIGNTGSISIAYSDNNIPLPSAGTTINSFTVTDQISFTVTYYYCNPGPLAEDLLTFTAVRENDQTVLLNWSTANEQASRKYVVEVSKDGTNFTGTATVDGVPAAGDATYSYNFPTDPAAKGKLYFRLRIEDIIGSTHYSPIRIVDLGNGNVTGFSIYPNPPSDFINLTLPGDNQNWQVEIYAADGNLIQQNYFPTTNLAHLNFNSRMASGAYFVRAVNPQTNQKYNGSFVIRN